MELLPENDRRNLLKLILLQTGKPHIDQCIHDRKRIILYELLIQFGRSE